MKDGLHIMGDREVQRALNELPDKVYRKHLRRALKLEAKPLVKHMREKIRPHDKTGAWRKSIASKVKTYLRDFTVLCTVGARYKMAPHEHLAERGHRLVRGGTIKSGGRTRKAKDSSRTGKGTVVGEVKGIGALAAAYASMKNRMMYGLGRKMLHSVYREVAKQRAKNRA